MGTKIEFTPYLACAYAEGFCEGEGASINDQMEAWSYLICSGLAWSLQGWYGRNAALLIEQNLITKLGDINWEEIEHLSANN